MIEPPLIDQGVCMGGTGPLSYALMEIIEPHPTWGEKVKCNQNKDVYCDICDLVDVCNYVCDKKKDASRGETRVLKTSSPNTPHS